MKNRILSATIAAIIAFLACSSDGPKAQELTLPLLIPSSMLNTWCKSTEPEMAGECLAYILGFVGGVWAGAATSINTTQGGTCVPYDKLNTLEMHLYLRKFISENPDLESKPAQQGLAVAPVRAFPCGAK